MKKSRRMRTPFGKMSKAELFEMINQLNADCEFWSKKYRDVCDQASADMRQLKLERAKSYGENQRLRSLAQQMLGIEQVPDRES